MSIFKKKSRKIIAWVLTRTMDADKVLECLIKAKERRETDHPIVIQMITCHHTLEYAKYT